MTKESKQKNKLHEFNVSMSSVLNKSHNEKLKQSLKHSITPKRESKKTPQAGDLQVRATRFKLQGVQIENPNEKTVENTLLPASPKKQRRLNNPAHVAHSQVATLSTPAVATAGALK